MQPVPRESFSSIFPKLDSDKLKTKLKLEEEGFSRGKNNFPSFNASNLDDIEQKIIETIEFENNAAKTIYHDHYRSYENRINSMKPLGQRKFSNIATAASAKFTMQTFQQKNTLDNARLEIVRSDNELKKFKERNGLDISASYPPSRFLYFAIAFFLVVFETALSGQFFAKGNEFGLVGGYMTALAPSLLNVLIGYFLGEFGFRLAINKSISKKIGGIALCILLPLAILFLNLLVTHYRSAVSIMADNAAAVALESFFNSPFSLKDTESWLLFLFGTLFATIAAVDFWKMDDPYAGYGKIDRNHKEKIEAYEDTKSQLLEELNTEREHKLKDLERESSIAISHYREMQDIANSQQRLNILYLQHLDYLENNGNILLTCYRNLNISARSEQAPEHFLQKWKISTDLPMVSKIDFDAELKAFKEENDNSQIEFTKCVEIVNKDHHKTLTSYYELLN